MIFQKIRRKYYVLKGTKMKEWFETLRLGGDEVTKSKLKMVIVKLLAPNYTGANGSKHI
jgi:hypothetical protein